MNAVPVPEIALALAVVVVLLVLRAAWRINLPLPFVPRPSDFRRPIANDDQLRARIIAGSIVFALLSVPLILRLVPPNGSYGFRIPATQSSRAVWYPANAFSGWALVVAGAISTTLMLVLPNTVKRWMLWAAFIVPVIGAFLASLAYVSRLT